MTPADQGKRFAAVVQQAGLDIPVYVVPGVADAAADTLTNWRASVKAAQDALQGQAGATSVIDLGSCYAAEATVTAPTVTAPTVTAPTVTAPTVTTPTVTAPTGCVAQLPDTNVRLVAYPGMYGAGVAGAAERWANVFASAMATTDADATTILIAPLAAEATWPPTGVRDVWMRAAANAQVVLGIAGSPTLRRSAYEQDSRWKAPGLLGQWLLTPPLVATAANAAEASQGASVVSVSRGGLVWRDLLWYSAGVSRFDGNVRLDGADTRRRSRWAVFISPFEWSWRKLGWLWVIGAQIQDLPRSAVFFIALLAAFLTSVAVWNIPPPATSVTVTTTTTPGGTQTTTASTPPKPSLLDQNFARTVISGLGGLAVATLMLDTFDMGDAKAASQQFYVIWFVVWFFLLLIGSSLVKSVAEGFRVISYIGHPGWNLRWWHRWWARARWFLLTATDAFFNLIQGRNELKSTLWANAIRTAQLDALMAIDHVCAHLRAALVDYLNAQMDPCASPPSGERVEIADVRIAVSVLSDDKKRVYYVSWPPESASKSFPAKSVAFVAVAAVVTRWWEAHYTDPDTPKIVLFENAKKGDDAPLPAPDLPEGTLELAKYYQNRGSDYRSFVVIPIPPRPSDDGRRAGLHISFKQEDALRKIWPVSVVPIESPFGQDPYERSSHLLDTTPQPLDRLFHQSINVIESLLRHFNEDVFINDLRGRRRI